MREGAWFRSLDSGSFFPHSCFFSHLTLEMSGILPFLQYLPPDGPAGEKAMTADPSMVLCGCPQVIRMVKWPYMSNLFFFFPPGSMVLLAPLCYIYRNQVPG